MGHVLTVASALTSLALFELLRFPLFMLPQVVNNIVEAKVSVERIEDFLVEKEKHSIPSLPLRKTGLLMEKATFVWENAFKKKRKAVSTTGTAPAASSPSSMVWSMINPMRLYTLLRSMVSSLLDHFANLWNHGRTSTSSVTTNTSSTSNPLHSSTSTSSTTNAVSGSEYKMVPMEDEEIELIVKEALLQDAETEMILLEKEIQAYKQYIQEMQRKAIAFQRGELVYDDDDDEEEEEGEKDLLEGMNHAGERDELDDIIDQHYAINSTNATASTTSLFSNGSATMNDPFQPTTTTTSNNGSLIKKVNKKINKKKELKRKEKELQLLFPPFVNSPSNPTIDRSSIASTLTQSTTTNTDSIQPIALSHINFTATTGQLICVIGQVGSGKSSLLQSFLGNLKQCYGTLAVNGNIAYTAQLPFIQNSTLQENILFGLPFDETKYRETLRICALLPDLEVLPGGDQTEIGERGINLSGGQKARVALARAVYANRDIYLLDDPLSAVDAHVGKALFDDCIYSKLINELHKCVILVTNALQFVKYANYIIVLKDGKIVEQGTYDLLISGNNSGENSGYFAEMMNTLNANTNSANNAISTSEANTNSDGKGEKDGNIAEKGGQKKDPASTTGTSAAAAASTPSKPSQGKLITTEDREVGNVNRAVYITYFQSMGGIKIGIMIIVFFYLGDFMSILTSWWLSYWSQQASSDAANDQNTIGESAVTERNSRSYIFYLLIYIMLNILVVMAQTWREFFLRINSLTASKYLFESLIQAILYAPMSFYDTTPLGRIINRFSKDIYTIDESLPYTIRGYLGTMAKVTGILLYICIITPFFLIALIPIGLLYYFAQRYYIQTSRELTRIESTSRSPIYALFSETLEGLTTVRAFSQEKTRLLSVNRLLDNNQRSYFLNFSANCWLAVRLEFAGTLIVTLAALFAVLARPTPTTTEAGDPLTATPSMAHFASLAGLSISLALSVTQSLNWTVRMASDLESQMVSVERVKSYATMEQEKPHYLLEDAQLNDGSGGSQRQSNASGSGKSVMFDDYLYVILISLSYLPQ